MVDFIFWRNDGGVFSLHPEHNQRKVRLKVPGRDETECPKINEGMYKSDGPGTFKKLNNWNVLGAVNYHESMDRPKTGGQKAKANARSSGPSCSGP